MGMAVSSIGALGTFASTSDVATAGTALAVGTGMSGLLGFHMTASIGGADMPVVITVLNSYSGWALCAEGFMLDMPIMTVVGSLIGCSGAALARCRRLAHVCGRATPRARAASERPSHCRRRPRPTCARALPVARRPGSARRRTTPRWP